MNEMILCPVAMLGFSEVIVILGVLLILAFLGLAALVGLVVAIRFALRGRNVGSPTPPATSNKISESDRS